MKMKLGYLIGCNEALTELLKQQFPVKTCYKLIKFSDVVTEEQAHYRELMIKILREYCELENGQPKIDEDKNYILKPGYEDEAAQKINDLLNLEVEVPISFTLDEFDGHNFSGQELSVLYPLIEE